MKRLGIVAVGLALVVAIVVGGVVSNPFGGAGAEAQEPTASLSCSPTSVTPGGPAFDMQISVADVTDLAAYEWQLSFDPDVVTFVSATDGGFLGSTGRIPDCWVILPEPDIVWYGCVTPGMLPGPNGSGLLTTVTFQPAGYGFPRIAPVYVELADMYGNNMRVDVSVCSTVGGIAELPPLASAPGGSGMGGATYAVLAGAVAGVLAFAVLATSWVKRRGVR